MAEYPVVLLIEEQLDAGDAAQVRSLHADLPDPVAYHLLLPLDDAAARVESSLSSLSGGEMLAAAIPMSDVDLDAVREDCRQRSQSELDASAAALRDAGGTVASAAVISGSPTDELATKVGDVEAREAIVLTRPHIVAEFFHLDWTSQARRKLGVPVLHLLEHQNFDEQAEGL